MKKNKHLIMVIMMILLIGLLTACGSKGDEGEGEQAAEVESNEEVFPSMNDVPLGLNKISFEELIEKLDNKESFWLVTIDYDRETDAKEIGDKVGLEQIYDEELKEKGMGAYFVDLYESYDEHGGYLIDEDEFSEKYHYYESGLGIYGSDGYTSSRMFLVTNYGVRDFTSNTGWSIAGSEEKLEEWYAGQEPWEEFNYPDSVRRNVSEQVFDSVWEYEKLIGLH